MTDPQSQADQDDSTEFESSTTVPVTPVPNTDTESQADKSDADSYDPSK